MDWWAELFDERLPIVDGHVVLSERPGLGVNVDRKALERFRA
jgi:L-alanine-DL-glutamate epimerase-like enolase superfamily enzyme